MCARTKRCTMSKIANMACSSASLQTVAPINHQLPLTAYWPPLAASLILVLHFTTWGMAAEQEPKSGMRRALIICGHPGDDEHRQQFTATVVSLEKSLVERLQFDSDGVWVLFGGEEVAADAPRPANVRGPSTQESISSTITALKEVLGSNDSLWVLVIGHT